MHKVFCWWERIEQDCKAWQPPMLRKVPILELLLVSSRALPWRIGTRPPVFIPKNVEMMILIWCKREFWLWHLSCCFSARRYIEFVCAFFSTNSSSWKLCKKKFEWLYVNSAKEIFFQILWKSRYHILVTFKNYVLLILRFWLEKLNCGSFHLIHP